MDRDLIGLFNDAKAAKPGAFEDFFGQVESRVMRFGMRVCGHVDDARDTLQETLLSTFKALPRLEFADQRALNVWLYKVARNSCLLMRRKTGKPSGRELSLTEFLPEAGEGGHREISDWSKIPENDASREELRYLVRHAILDLPTQYRMVVVLRDLEGLTAQEVAEVLELPESTVKMRLHRGRLFLRKELERYFIADAPAKSGGEHGKQA